MNKKFVLALAFSLLCATCSATIPTSELEIGSIAPGNSPEYVQQIYGAPAKIKYGTNSLGQTMANEFYFTYGKSFKVRFHDNLAFEVISKANNGLSTPSGIHVGSTVWEVKRAFGDPDELPARLKEKTNILRYIDRPYTRELILKMKKGIVTEMKLRPANGYE